MMKLLQYRHDNLGVESYIKSEMMHVIHVPVKRIQNKIQEIVVTITNKI